MVFDVFPSVSDLRPASLHAAVKHAHACVLVKVPSYSCVHDMVPTQVLCFVIECAALFLFTTNRLSVPSSCFVSHVHILCVPFPLPVRV